MSKYIHYGVYYDSHTERQIILIEKVANTDFWIAETFAEKEPYIIVFESDLQEIGQILPK